jgi:hypothetical protein
MPNTPNSVVVLDQFGNYPALSGLVGITNGSLARPGNVGEIITSLVLVGAAVSVANNTIVNNPAVEPKHINFEQRP